MADAKRKRILSGVQPSGKLHLGNYFGAIRQHIALQDQGECFYFIADYHALTTLGDAVQADAEAAKDQKRQAARRRRHPPRERPRRGPRLPGPRPRPDEGHLLPPVRRARR